MQIHIIEKGRYDEMSYMHGNHVFLVSLTLLHLYIKSSQPKRSLNLRKYMYYWTYVEHVEKR